MKKFYCLFLMCLLLGGMNSAEAAKSVSISRTKVQLKPIVQSTKTTNVTSEKPKQAIKIAFIFDGPSDKNQQLLKTFKETIAKSIAQDFKASYPDRLVFTGNWSNESVKQVSEKALGSDATMVVSLGYMSSTYLANKKDRNKFVVTIYQYGLKGIDNNFFDPIQQNVNDFATFKKITNFNKTAILINENFYKNRKNWDALIKKRFEDKGLNIDFKVVSVGHDMNKTLQDIGNDVDAVFITPLFNLSDEERKNLFTQLNNRKLKTFSNLGKEDVTLGVLLGSGQNDLDKKLAEATSFNIQGVLYKGHYKSEKPCFYEDTILYINTDTADEIGYQPHLRVLNTAEIISNKTLPVYSLTAVFDTLEKQNLDIERKKLLIKAARRSSLSAKLRYLPSFGVTLGYQEYNEDYVKTAKNLVPQETGVFQMGIDQVIYSPALVTNILISNKKVDFSKAEQFLTEQNMGIETALLYIDTLMLDNMVKIQKEYVKESRENLAIARTRKTIGASDSEEVYRWAAQLSITEQKLLDMNADLNNVKIDINKLLHKTQNEKYNLAELKASDPAFYTKDIHIIDYVSTPKTLEKFTQMLVAESIRVSPELVKLKAAVKMKDYEMSMYIQRFILPDAKLSLEYTSYFNREFGINPALTNGVSAPTNGRMGIFAQWKPIEGGHKFAEIARIKAEKQELQRYQEEVETSLEQHIREVINRALASYFSIQKNYKAMNASQENYYMVKNEYLKGTAPIEQLIDAQETYLNSKLKMMNSQYEFFKELVWVQRGICSVNWAKATPESKQFIESVKTELEKNPDFNL